MAARGANDGTSRENAVTYQLMSQDINNGFRDFIDLKLHFYASQVGVSGETLYANHELELSTGDYDIPPLIKFGFCAGNDDLQCKTVLTDLSLEQLNGFNFDVYEDKAYGYTDASPDFYSYAFGE